MMAKYNEILVGRYNRAFQKLLSMKGGASIVTLSDDMLAVFPLFWGSENRYLEGWDRFGSAVQVPGAAAVTSGARFRNPAGSNIIVVVELLSLTETVGAAVGQLTLGATTTDLSATATAVPFDTRGRSASTMILSGQSTPPAFGLVVLREFAAANANLGLIGTDIQEFPLLPGSALQWVTGGLNSTLNASIFWRERFLEESERT